MISKKLSDHFFTINKDKQTFLLDSKPTTNMVHEDLGTYVYIEEIGSRDTARLFKAESDLDALIKAEKQMVKEGHFKAIIGIYVGKDENKNKIYMDLIELRAIEAVNEVLSDSLSKEISSQAVRFGLEHNKGNTETKVKLNGALSMLSIAQSMNDDSQARKLLNLAKRIATASVTSIVDPIVAELKKLKKEIK